MRKGLITKTFEYKGQMVNYYNKAKANPDIAFICCGFFFDTGKYTVMYSYK